MLSPAFNLDFTTAVLDPNITFSRALNTATRVNASGLIEVVNADVARFDFNPITKVCHGLLIEEERINIARQSQDFNTTWSTFNSTVTVDTHVAPDGTLTGDTITVTANNGNVSYLRGVTNGVNYTFSVWAKQIDSPTVRIGFTNVDDGPIFTFASESFTTIPGGWTAGFQKFDNGWYRIWGWRSSNTTFAGIQFSIATSGQSVALWGAQMELGASVTSYIPVTTTNVTRNADVATITGTAFSGLWRSGPGSLLVRALPSTVSGTRPLVQVDDNTADNIIALRGNTTNPELYIRAGGVDQATIDAGTISAAAYRLAGAWQAGSAAASLNSGLAVNGAPGSIPAVTQMRLGSDGTNYLNGHLQAVEYYDERVLNANLQLLSSSAGRQGILRPLIRNAI